MRRLSIEWTRHLKDEKQKLDFENAVRNSSVMSLRLIDLLAEWETEIRRKQIGGESFTVPNWAYQQAYLCGELARIQKLKDLFTFAKP